MTYNDKNKIKIPPFPLQLPPLPSSGLQQVSLVSILQKMRQLLIEQRRDTQIASNKGSFRYLAHQSRKLDSLKPPVRFCSVSIRIWAWEVVIYIQQFHAFALMSYANPAFRSAFKPLPTVSE